ncbi:FecCD family ABC transporter permease [Clostridium botulinum]|uniref:FecCD family ABC transporter permease n=1 Tax=Clostridium botulinum TaxID=1491 RepID=UPI0004DA5CB4|nr:iron ABC transporter permease [Clostridium botulinum]KEI00860.1 ABC transporter [Clostridium botulinum C/D str. BKT75002]KEI09174.1 ABC transporter [Clostridium botulinum C/D str. BKT2873]QPW61433.1 iron ABC transporter permease [Clostridium botulinum]
MKSHLKTNKSRGIFNGMSIYIGISILLSIFLIFSISLAVTIGSYKISVDQVYEIIIYKIFNIGNASVLSSGAIHDIVWFIRLPRIILAVVVGMGLSISGVIMQAVIKNLLADPYILGISSGASLGATLAVMLGVGVYFGSNYVGVCAFIGALIISVLVLILANVKGRANSTKLLLSGLALSSVCSAFASFIVYIANNKEGIQTITYWLMGSFAGAKWESIKVILAFLIMAIAFFMTQCRTLNLMLLGDEVSITLGTDLHRYRQIYLVIVSIIIGFIVYSSGMIGFVGLIIPHITRMLFGTDHKKIIIPSALIGAIFLVWADVISRIIIKGNELPIGILISMIGAPGFIYLMISKAYGFGGD